MTASFRETPDARVRGFLFELCETDGRLCLHARHHPRFLPLAADWLSAEMRRRIAGGRRQLLARAVGLHKAPALQVLDTTAGLGRDGFVLAALGARVTLVERQPLLAALLRDVRARALADPDGQAAAGRIELIEDDAATVLAGSRRWDVVHLDPMYPHRDKQALPQKEMQLLRELIGDSDTDADALLVPALAAARRRVVVKRPMHAPFLAGRRPDFQLAGTQARYDVYTPPPSLDR